jgi:hypothetical protein
VEIDFGLIMCVIECAFLICYNCISIVLHPLMYPPLMVEVREQHGVSFTMTLGAFEDLNKLFKSFYHILQPSEALKTSDL